MLLCLGTVLIVWPGKSQVVFTSKPGDLAFIPRDVKTNQAEVKISGNALNGLYNSANLKAYQNGKLINNQYISLNYSSGAAPFDFRIKLKGGKYRYSFQIRFIGSDSFIQNIGDVVVGDVFLIQGQSNAVANSYYGTVKPKYTDSFIRSFGTSYPDYNSCLADTFWHIADGDGLYNVGCIGQWGMVLAKSILDSFGIPVAMLNGAVGGTPITYHQRYNIDPANLFTNYGRLLYRVRKAGIQKNIRGILYFQGESDGGQPKLHDSLFRVMYADWFKDYSGMTQNYVVQVRGNGCGGVTAELCEYQRMFEFTLQRLKVISTNGLNGHDGCHYYLVNGYELLGKQLAALTARDLYGSSRKTNIDPPGIASVFYSNASHSEITLNMRQPNDSIFVDPNFQQLFYLTGDNSVSITGGSVVKNHVVLTLNKGTCNPLFLTYLGNVGVEPWVKNSTKCGLVGFDKIPIQKPVIKSIYSGCPGKDFLIGEDSIAGYKYKWIRKRDGAISTSAKVNVNSTKAEAYTAIVYYKNLSCNSDTFSVLAFVDTTVVPSLGNDTLLCNGDSIYWRIPDQQYVTLQWKQNSKTSSGVVFASGTAGIVSLTVTSPIGCVYQDNITVTTSTAAVKISGEKVVCSGLMSELKASGNFINYWWNGTRTADSSFSAKAGKVSLTVENADGCVANDSTIVSEYPFAKVPALGITICPYDSASLTMPAGFRHWFQQKKLLPVKVFFSVKSPLEIELEDSNGCVLKDTIVLKKKQLPIFSLGKDTMVCAGKMARFVCLYSAQVYEWNGVRSTSPKFETGISGSYYCMVQNADGCWYADTVNLGLYPNPEILVPDDTVLCEGDSWKPALDQKLRWTVNGQPAQHPEISLSGIYFFGAESDQGCNAVKKCVVSVVKCTNSVTQFETDLKVFPNPCSDYLMLAMTGKEKAGWFVSDLCGRRMASGLWMTGQPVFVGMLPTGVYTLTVENRSILFVRK